MVLLVLLLCSAKASLFEPAKDCMQPAKARPALPWWRCRVWLCRFDGYVRELHEDEEDEIEEIFDRNSAAAKYVWQQSSENLAGNCWWVSWWEPQYLQRRPSNSHRKGHICVGNCYKAFQQTGLAVPDSLSLARLSLTSLNLKG